MDIQQLLASGVVAAIVSSLFGFLTTILTLRSQRNADLRKRALDRYDRLYAKIKVAQETINQAPVSSLEATDFDSIKDTWVKLTQTLKVWYDAYSSCSELFDEDIRGRVTQSVAEYDAAYAAFRSNPEAPGATERVLRAARITLKTIPEAANEQLTRLAKI